MLLVDLKNPQLPGLHHHCTILWHLRPYVDLPPPFPQPEDPLGRADRIPHRWPLELNWETQQYKCWISQIITFVLLASLQAVNLFWLFLILRILKNYIFNSVKKDERSDDETEEELEHEAESRATLATGAEQPLLTTRNTNKAPQVFVNGEPYGAKTHS